MKNNIADRRWIARESRALDLYKKACRYARRRHSCGRRRMALRVADLLLMEAEYCHHKNVDASMAATEKRTLKKAPRRA